MSPSTSFFISDTDKDVGKIPPSTLFLSFFRGGGIRWSKWGIELFWTMADGGKVFWKVRPPTQVMRNVTTT